MPLIYRARVVHFSKRLNVPSQCWCRWPICTAWKLYNRWAAWLISICAEVDDIHWVWAGEGNASGCKGLEKVTRQVEHDFQLSRELSCDLDPSFQLSKNIRRHDVMSDSPIVQQTRADNTQSVPAKEIATKSTSLTYRIMSRARKISRVRWNGQDRMSVIYLLKIGQLSLYSIDCTQYHPLLHSSIVFCFTPSLGRVRRLCRGLEKFSPPVLQRCYGCSFDAQEIVHTGHGILGFFLFSFFLERKVPAQTKLKE